MRAYRPQDAGAPTKTLLLPLRSKARGTGVAEVKRVVFEIRRLHLQSQMIDAETIVQFSAQLFQKFWLRDAVCVYHMSA